MIRPCFIGHCVADGSTLLAKSRLKNSSVCERRRSRNAKIPRPFRSSREQPSGFRKGWPFLKCESGSLTDIAPQRQTKTRVVYPVKSVACENESIQGGGESQTENQQITEILSPIIAEKRYVHGQRKRLPMMMPAIIGFLIGAAVAQRFKVLMLIPVVLLTLLIIVAGSVTRTEALWNIALAALIVTGSLQIGYLAGSALRHARAGDVAPKIASSAIGFLISRRRTP
jgi:hypothetical protein